MMKRIGELKAENARLKEKSECQAQGIDAFDKKLREAEAEVARLKTENSGLRAGIESLERVDNKIIARLKEENEQLFFASQGSVKYVDHQMAFARQATEHHKEMDCLKAEIERLNATLQQAYVDFEERIRNEAAHPACIKLNRLVGDKNNEIARLKAEVERLHARWLQMLDENKDLRQTNGQYHQVLSESRNLEAENARLKAEVERMTTIAPKGLFDFSVEHLTRLFNDGRIDEVSYEGERSQWYCADAYARCVRAEIEAKRLKAEVERLTKAGDAAIEHLRWQGGKHTKEVIIPAWNAAKEGKQP
jgi:regulator of replication initiation timing